MRRSIGLSTLRSAAPRTTAGGTICPVEKASGVGGDTKAAARWIISRTEWPSIGARPTFTSGAKQVTGKGDLMLFAKYGQAVLVTHERRSRLLVVSRQPNKAAEPVASKLCDPLRGLPKTLRRTITFDNGTEFAYHYRLHKLSMRTFFCDAHAPWQKGGIENAIGRMRRGLPRKTDLATLSDHRLLSLVRSYNHTPRKCLNYQTPAEVFCHGLLHFKCESTFPPARE